MADNPPDPAAIAVNRFGLGARPGELARATDARRWLLAQIEGAPPTLALGTLRSTRDVLSEVARVRAEAAPRKRDAAMPIDAKALVRIAQIYRPVYLDEVAARFRSAVETSQPFAERLVHFWSNHFAVSVDKVAVLGLAGAFEREAIRPHVFGRFESMLFAVERHPAMLLYLDNHLSIGPDSALARRAARAKTPRELGLNENLAREILELHTLGVDGGYTQSDVTSFARMITGWSIGGGQGRLTDGNSGEFTYREAFHDPGAKSLLGERYADDGYEQGASALRKLAMHPSTARHLASKLARHFVTDDPPPALVDRMAGAYLSERGALGAMYRELIAADATWTTAYAKFKTPADFVHSTYRGLGLPVGEDRKALAPFETLGQRIWSPKSPAGWPDRGADWDGASAILKRIEWADALAARLNDRRNAAGLAPELLGKGLSRDTMLAIARAASGAQAITLLLASPEFLRR